MRARLLLGCGVVLAALGGLYTGDAGAATPVSDAGGVSFSYVAGAGHTTLPTGAYLDAEHFTFALLDVHTGEDGKQVLAAIKHYATAACTDKQRVILDKMRPALLGLSVVIEGASQAGTSTVDVRFGGADTLTQTAIYGLVKGYQATMQVGLLETTGGWRVTTARLLGTARSKPACA